MIKTWSLALGGAMAIGAAVAVAVLLPERGVTAADHLDPPARADPLVDPTPDKAADLADIYAFHTADRLTVMLTFGGPQATNLPAVYDRDVLYKLNISNAGSPTDAEVPITIRFGQAGANNGVQVSGIPGSGGPIVGSVETEIVQNGIRVFAGLRDDPFFFDSQGLRESRTTGTLSFNRNRDFFGAQNVTVVAIDMPRSAVENGTNPLTIWSTTARFGGQI